MTDWDNAFDNSSYVPGAAELPARWAANAAAYRQQAGRRIDLDIAYGDHSRERFDLIWPDGSPKGLAVFVHGGYWMQMGRSDWTDLAEGARANGWAVCLPSYTLAPEGKISAMTRQIGRAITTAADQVAGSIRLAGHSAGGHLVSRMACADTPLPQAVIARLDHVLSISGLHDLRPLLKTKMNDTLGLDLAEATHESVALQMPHDRANLTAWVGGNERPELIRQTKLLVQMWQGLDTNVRCQIDGTHDHFSVIADLKKPDSPITKAFIR